MIVLHLLITFPLSVIVLAVVGYYLIYLRVTAP
jgi:hypothetical protein